MRSVTIIREENGMALVEWLDDDKVPQRNSVKASSLLNREGNSAQVAKPEQGLYYGVDFVRTLRPSVTSKDITRELRLRGLWTAADVQKHPSDVMSALQSAYGLDMAQVIVIARDYEKTTED